MKANAFRSAAALTFSVALAGAGVIAQSTPPSQQPTTRQGGQSNQALRAMDGQTVTVTGCLMAEADAPGQTPNPAERAGIAPDFILTNTQVKSASPGGSTGSPTTGAPTTGAPTTGAPTTGAPTTGAPMSGSRGPNIKLTSIDSDKVKPNLNKQVEVTGKLDVPDSAGTTTGSPTTERPTAGATGAAGANRALAELDVQSIRVVGQSCTP